MDLNLLPAFIAIYDTRSVSEAAARLKLSQPGMSALLGRLRTTFADALFVRTPTGMVPTARARALEEPVRRMLAVLEREILVSKDFCPAEATNEFRLATSDGGEVAFLPPILKVVSQEAPNVKITSLETRQGEVARLLESDGLDLAIGYVPELKSSNIIETVVGHITFSCFVGNQNPLAGRDVSAEEFRKAKHAIANPHGRSDQIAERFLAEKGVEDIAFRTAHFLCIPEVLAKTNLIAVMPDMIRGQATFSNLARINVPFEMPYVETKMYWSRMHQDDPGHRWFRTLATREIRKLASPPEEVSQGSTIGSRAAVSA